MLEKLKESPGAFYEFMESHELTKGEWEQGVLNRARARWGCELLAHPNGKSDEERAVLAKFRENHAEAEIAAQSEQDAGDDEMEVWSKSQYNTLLQQQQQQQQKNMCIPLLPR